MSKSNKYYAVRKGTVPGIYRTWDECKDSIDQFPGAEYKSFKTEPEAIAYMNGNNISSASIVNKYDTVAYIGSSFSEELRRSGYGIVIVRNNETTTMSNIAKFQTSYYVKQKHLAAELLAVMEVIKWCEKNNIDEIVIYYKIEGLVNWANGSWKANNKLCEAYQELMKSTKVKYTFTKVPSHTHNHHQDHASKLARAAYFKKIERYK